MAAVMNKPKLWTKEGLLELAELVKQSREDLGRKLGLSKKMSLRDLEDYIEERTGHRISNSSLSGLERTAQLPTWNTLAIIAAAGFVLKPDGTPYTVEELSAIASQTYNEKNELRHRNDELGKQSDNLYPRLQLNFHAEGDMWNNNEHVCIRIQNLINASLKKSGFSGRPGQAAEAAGINPATFDRAALRAFTTGSVSRMQGTTVSAGLENAIAAICFEIIGGWEQDTPRNLGNTTYKGRPAALLRDVSLNHEHQTV